MENAAIDVHQHIAFLMDVCAQRGAQFIAINLGEFNLTLHGYYVLLSITREKNLTQKQLSEYLCLNVNTITRLLDTLEDKRYAKRTMNQDNRKENLLEATPLGEKTVKAALVKIMRLRDTAYSDITKEERTELHRILKKLFLSGGPK